MSRRKRIGALDHLLGATLALGYIALLMASSSELAMSRDESFYVVAAERYGAWFEALFEDPSAALEPSAIDREWGYNHEHPALIKSLFALSHLAHSRWDLFADDSMAYRFPAIVLAGLLIWLIYIFGARAYARDAGLFAALSFALLPRVFYHAHLACFDVPIVFLITLVTYCYWRSLTHPSWALWTGLSFGLALATKHNSWVLPGIFGVHFAWMALRERGWRRLDPRGKRVSCVPHWLYAMILLGPMILVLSWPYVWHDTLERLGWYAAFHLRHDYYNMAYFGVNYFRPPFPIGFPFVMAMFTLPATFLLLALTGMLRRVPVLLPARWLARLELRDRIDRSQTDLLFYGSIAAPLLMIALPSSPIFGGTKHWMPAYPFMALFAGLSFALLARSVRRWLGLHPLLARQLLRGLIASLLLLPSALETVHSHPFGLSHYTYLAGGVPGAADHGMNRQFWGFTTGSVVPFLREAMPEGGTVYLCDTTYEAWAMLWRDGRIPRNIRPSPSLSAADYVLVHHEHHFAEIDFQAWIAFGSVAPAYVLTYDGVPIVSVYENPRRRAARLEAPSP